MRIFGLFLAVVCFVTLSAMGAEATKDAKGGADPVQAMFDRLGKMTPSEQQAWLKQLEERAARAARLTLKPDEATRQQAKTRSQLHQKVIAWQTLRAVIDETSTREKDAIDRLVRRYRGLVFDTFHKEIDVYGQRQQAWLDLYLEWKLAGGRFEQQGRLIAWLEEAIRSATPGTIGRIPEKPKFEDEQPAAEAAPQQPADITKPQAATKPEAIEKPKSETKQPPVQEEAKRPADITKPQAATKPEAIERPKSEEKQPPVKEKAKQPAEIAKPQAATKPKNIEKPKSEAKQPPVKEEAKQPVEIAKPQAATKPEAIERPKSEAKQPPVQEEAKQPAEIAKPQVATKPEAIEKPKSEAKQPPVKEEAKRPADVAKPQAATKPKAIEKPKPEVKQPPAKEELPATAAKAATGESSAGSVEIKQDELSVRISGCNLALRALEAELDEKGDWTPARLEPLVDRLKILVIRHNDLHLFREAVPAEKRSSIEPLASAQSVISQLAARIFEARGRTAGPDFTGKDSERQTELRRLQELSRRLAELAGK